ncbi:MAG: lamin tail domain-containing protein [Candidatus Poribacteria bacterium]|nr:lamin tail domain-containing protein [Candidatus Poribacteria bacterium]
MRTEFRFSTKVAFFVTVVSILSILNNSVHPKPHGARIEAYTDQGFHYFLSEEDAKSGHSFKMFSITISSGKPYIHLHNVNDDGTLGALEYRKKLDGEPEFHENPNIDNGKFRVDRDGYVTVKEDLEVRSYNKELSVLTSDTFACCDSVRFTIEVLSEADYAKRTATESTQTQPTTQPQQQATVQTEPQTEPIQTAPIQTTPQTVPEPQTEPTQAEPQTAPQTESQPERQAAVEIEMGRVAFSELMIATRTGNSRFPQWIELYNSNPNAADLEGWKLEIYSLDDDAVHTSGEYVFYNLSIPSKETLLLVMSGGRRSENIDTVKSIRTIWTAIGSSGFCIKLSDPNGVVSDIAGNIDCNGRTKDSPEWDMPEMTTADMERSSLLRRYDPETDLPLDGKVLENWKPAANITLKHSSYYGHRTDIGTPGYRNREKALPVRLSSFKPQRSDDGVIIKWQTESELNNAGFNIFRSQTPTGKFVKVNSRLIEGHGTSSESHTYRFVDKDAKPNVAYYYRIEDVSFAGDRQTLITKQLRGVVSSEGKLTTSWAQLKLNRN